MIEVERRRDVPAAVNDEVDDDVFAEVVAVLERDIDRALDVCMPWMSSAMSVKGAMLTFRVVAVDVQDRSIDHLCHVRAVQGRPGA